MPTGKRAVVDSAEHPTPQPTEMRAKTPHNTSTYAVLHGDCLKLDWPDFDVLITDPPYGINLHSNGRTFRKARPVHGDDSHATALEISRRCPTQPLVMFFSPYAPLPLLWRNILVWSKGAQTGGGGDRRTCWKRDFELIGIRNNRPLNGKRDSAVLQYYGFVVPPSGHPNEKPRDLLRYLILKLTQPGDVVFDPCMGSGTTGEACAMTRRSFVGIEIDPHYYAYAEQRIATAYGETL